MLESASAMTAPSTEALVRLWLNVDLTANPRTSNRGRHAGDNATDGNPSHPVGVRMLRNTAG